MLYHLVDYLIQMATFKDACIGGRKFRKTETHGYTATWSLDYLRVADLF